MAVRYEIRIPPTYVSASVINIGARAVRENGMSPGPITVRVAELPEFSVEATLNKGHGIKGLGELYRVLGLESGHVLHFEVPSSDTVVIVDHGPSQSLHTGSLKKEPIKRSRTKSYRPLNDVHKQFIAAEIARLAVVAREAGNPMRRIARFLIDSLLWCWTADGINDAGEAGRDKLKYDCAHQMHTVDALARWEANGKRGTGLRHEHAVPRKMLLKCLLESPKVLSETEVFEFLNRLCFAIIVTTEEDRLFSGELSSNMPQPWDCGAQGEARFARYEAVGLSQRILKPGLIANAD